MGELPLDSRRQSENGPRASQLLAFKTQTVSLMDRNNNTRAPPVAIPEDLLGYYKRLEGKEELRVTLDNLHMYSYSHGNVPAKRGYEFKFCPVYDVRTDTLWRGDPHTLVSAKTKKELRDILAMCARAQPPVTPRDLTAAQIDAAKEPKGHLECDTCQGKHDQADCPYACHRCISTGPFNERGHRQCDPALRPSNIHQEYSRGVVLYQMWPPSTHPVHRDVFVIDRRPRFRELPHDFMQILRAAIRDFNGSVLLVDVSTYDAWRAKLEDADEDGLEAPVRIKMPYRMIGLYNVEFCIALLKDIYIPVVEARQGTRYACFAATLSERRYFEAQRDPSGGYRIQNMQEIVEVVLTIQDYEPEENELHAELGEMRAGARMFIFPHGVCDRNRDGSVHIPEHRFRQILKKAPYHPLDDDGREDLSKLCLLWDGFRAPDEDRDPGQPENGFDFRGRDVLLYKRPRESFARHLRLLRMSEVEQAALLEVYDRSDTVCEPDEGDYTGAFARTLYRLGIGINAFMDLVYYNPRQIPATGKLLYTKRPWTAVSDMLRRHPPAVHPALRRIYDSQPPTSELHPGFLESVEILRRAALSPDVFQQLAYHTETRPCEYDLDFAHDEGLYDMRRTYGVFSDYQRHIDDQPPGHLGVKEMFGPPGLGCLRVITECFTGGPAIAQAQRAAFRHALNVYPDPAKTLWADETREGYERFMRTVLGEHVQLDADQQEALESMFTMRLFVLIGLPGSGKTRLTCAAVLWAMLVYGERILILTETNPGAEDMYKTLVGMLAALEAQFPREMAVARGRVRGDFRWVSRSLSKDSPIDETDVAVARICQTKGRRLIASSRIVVSTLGHARSKAVQCFRADTIVIDESARSTLLSVLTVLLERWLNTSVQTTNIMPDKTEDGEDVPVCNAHPAQRLILVGDPSQGLPQTLSQPITDKRTAWALGETLNTMTSAIQCGARFVRLSRSFRSSYVGIQPLFDRFYNGRLGHYVDTMKAVLAVKDAPVAVRQANDLPLVVGAHLECDSLRAALNLDVWKGRYNHLESEPDDARNLRFRHVVVRTSDPGNKPLSRRNKLKSQVNPWHCRVIMDILEALFTDGVLVRVDEETGERVVEKVAAKHILLVTPYRGQMHALNRALHSWFPERADLPEVRVMTSKSVQGLQAPIVVKDFVKSTPSEFLLGHHMQDFQSHHNEIYNVGLSRFQTTQFTIATRWPLDGGKTAFNRRGGRKDVEPVEKSYLEWSKKPYKESAVSNARFSRPGDRIPVDNRGHPVVDPTNDNLWLFFVHGEKFHDRVRWTFRDAYYWQRGVGTVHKPRSGDVDETSD